MEGAEKAGDGAGTVRETGGRGGGEEEKGGGREEAEIRSSVGTRGKARQREREEEKLCTFFKSSKEDDMIGSCWLAAICFSQSST